MKGQKQKSERGKSSKKKRSVENSSSGWIGQILRTVREEIRSTFNTEGKMKATTLLKEDHDKVIGLIQQLKSARKNKTALVTEIEKEIQIHSECEETIFYPEVKKIDSELIAESLEEHHQVDLILAELKEMTGEEGEVFDAKVTVLEEMLKHHMEEEEGEMFPKAEKELKDQLEELGAEIEYFKGELAVKRGKAA